MLLSVHTNEGVRLFEHGVLQGNDNELEVRIAVSSYVGCDPLDVSDV